MPGGTSYYFSHGIRRLKDFKNYKLVTAVAPSEYGIIEEMRKEGIQVEVLPSRHTVYFENTYEDVYFENTYEENQDNRSQRVLAKADPFTADALKDENAHIFHLGSLLADDFPLEVVKELAQKGTLAVDAQGYLRKVEGEHVFPVYLRKVEGEHVFPVDWHEKKKALKYIDILKVNEHEAEVLTGFKDPEKAAKQLAQWGVKEVLLTLGSLGSLIYAEGKFYKIPAYAPKEVVDATGCGDTYVLPDAVTLTYLVISTCETKELHTKKQDVLQLPCLLSSWRNPVLFPERKKKYGIF